MLIECIYPPSYIVYFQTLNFTFAWKAILRIYIFAWLLLLWQHKVITLPRVTGCCCDEAETSEVTFLYISPQPPLHLEPDYIVRKPMKHWFQRYIVRMEIFSTFHARVEYISRKQYVIMPIQINGTECTQTHKSENIISASFTPFSEWVSSFLTAH